MHCYVIIGGGITMFLLKYNITFQEFIMENQRLSILVGGLVVLIALIIVFICLRVKLRNQEEILNNSRMQEERYRVLAEMSNDILFDYYIQEDEMVYSDKFTENFGRKAKIERFAELKEELQYVYKDDVFAFENFVSF